MTEQIDQVELLLRLVRGQLSAVEARRLRAKLKSNRELARLYRLIEMMEADRSAESPELTEAATELAAQQFDDLAERSRGVAASGVRVFDSKLLPLPVGVRPAMVDTRRLKYRFGDIELMISAYPISPESYELIGRVSGATSTVAYTISMKRGRRVMKAPCDRHGLFRFERVRSGQVRLGISSGEQDIGQAQLEL